MEGRRTDALNAAGMGYYFLQRYTEHKGIFKDIGQSGNINIMRYRPVAWAQTPKLHYLFIYYKIVH